MHVMRAARVSNVVMDFLSKRTSLPQRSSYAWNSKQPSYPHSTALFARYLSSTSRKMVKDAQTVIEEFNQLVNMSPDELKDWLGSEESTGSGWSKDDGSGETIGHESGRKIIKILEKNPKKDPGKYDEDDVDHMRRVVAYCKRHLAQEEKAKKDTNSKSYKSLKNWGHDAQKT